MSDCSPPVAISRVASGFLDPRATEFWADWNVPPATQAARSSGPLVAHNGRFHRTGIKHIHHPHVGDLTLSWEVLDLTADTGQSVLVYTAEPNSATHDALQLLASWAASSTMPP